MDPEKIFGRRFPLFPKGYLASPQLHFSDLF
jgi:hypothetical protein